jgi:hypothetical protein
MTLFTFPVGMPAEEGDERVVILADEDSRAQLQLTWRPV